MSGLHRTGSDYRDEGAIQHFSDVVGEVQNKKKAAEVQVKTTCEEWVNIQLAKIGAEPCTDLSTYFSDGVGLAALLEAVTERKIKVKRPAKNTAQKLDNINHCLEFVSKLPMGKGSKATLSTSDFMQGNLKHIVPFVLKLIRIFDAA